MFSFFCQVAAWLPVSRAIPATCDGWPTGFRCTNAAVIAQSHNGEGRGEETCEQEIDAGFHSSHIAVSWNTKSRPKAVRLGRISCGQPWLHQFARCPNNEIIEQKLNSFFTFPVSFFFSFTFSIADFTWGCSSTLWLQMRFRVQEVADLVFDNALPFLRNTIPGSVVVYKC